MRVPSAPRTEMTQFNVSVASRYGMLEERHVTLGTWADNGL